MKNRVEFIAESYQMIRSGSVNMDFFLKDVEPPLKLIKNESNIKVVVPEVEEPITLYGVQFMKELNWVILGFKGRVLSRVVIEIDALDYFKLYEDLQSFVDGTSIKFGAIPPESKGSGMES